MSTPPEGLTEVGCKPFSISSKSFLTIYNTTPLPMRHTLRVLSAAILTAGVTTAGHADTSQPTIVDHITAGGTNVVVMPEELLQRLVFTAPAQTETPEETQSTDQPRTTSGRVAGYRVQVFSDNNARTAKNEARSKQRLVASKFPQYQTYVQYNSPYWRVKVGDFRTQQEAAAAAEEMRKAFPAYKKEIRVVRDRIAH
ncbi:MAG: SPOR domain-containing protein [Duncaniella sp.]|nr:SPOR domain-containing protein [Duncaniella sp.]